MIAWQSVALLWALPVAALPILIHLLRRHRADRVPFPSLRFVRASPAAAVRIRRPSDLVLLLLRVAALAAAVFAAAGPTAITPARLDQWNRKTARAIVVDVSDSMRVAGADGIPAETAAGEAADAEEQSATYATRTAVAELGSGVRRAAAWLATTPPSRREIVVISDFQRGSFDAETTAGLDPSLGIRLVRVGLPVTARRIAGPELLGAGSIPARAYTIELTGDTTSVSFKGLGQARRPAGLRILPVDASTEALLRVVAAAGTPAPSAAEPVVVRFVPDDPATPRLQTVLPGWMLRTLLRFQNDMQAQAPSTERAVRTLGESQPWSVLHRDSTGKPLVAAAAAGSDLVVDVAARPDGFFAAAVVRSLLGARRGPGDDREEEVARVDETVLSALNREAAPLDVRVGTSDVWKHADSTDGRWCWAVALVLLGAEQWLRSRTSRSRQQGVTRVAA